MNINIQPITNYSYDYFIINLNLRSGEYEIINVKIFEIRMDYNEDIYVVSDEFKNTYERRLEDIYGKQDIEYLRLIVNKTNEQIKKDRKIRQINRSLKKENADV